MYLHIQSFTLPLEAAKSHLPATLFFALNIEVKRLVRTKSRAESNIEALHVWPVGTRLIIFGNEAAGSGHVSDDRFAIATGNG